MGISTEEYNKRKEVQKVLDKGSKVRENISKRYSDEVSTVIKDALSYAERRSNPQRAVEEVKKYWRTTW